MAVKFKPLFFIFSYIKQWNFFTFIKHSVQRMCVPMPTHCTILRVSGSTQGGQMALNVVYFRITHRLCRPHYVLDEYLYSVLQKVEVRVT